MRSANMVVLTDQLKKKHPGVVIYGIGDAAHKRSSSGHNEDDTPGSKAEDQDADSKPEHRALDVMIGPKFSTADAWNLVAALVTIPENRRRLLYVIFMRTIWSRKNGWEADDYTGSDPHTNHPHISGEADDDENRSPWILETPAVSTDQEDEVKFIYASGRGWARVGSVFQPLSNQVLANVNAKVFTGGNSHTISDSEYDSLKASYAPEDVRQPI